MVLEHEEHDVNGYAKESPRLRPTLRLDAQAGPGRRSEGRFMKGFPVLGLISGALLMAGCQSPLVVQSAAGPEPVGLETQGTKGQLVVFSAKEARGDGDDPTYYQHSDYWIYDLRWKRVKYAGNTTGHFDEAPRLVQLPPGSYSVKARAECYGLVVVPVVIKGGRTTVLHLDKDWKSTASGSNADLVTLPGGGYAIGWSAAPSHPANGH